MPIGSQPSENVDITVEHKADGTFAFSTNPEFNKSHLDILKTLVPKIKPEF